jgi:hypothetical protein
VPILQIRNETGERMSRFWRAYLLGFSLLALILLPGPAFAASRRTLDDFRAKISATVHAYLSNKVTEGPDKPVQTICYSPRWTDQPKTVPAGRWWLYPGLCRGMCCLLAATHSRYKVNGSLTPPQSPRPAWPRPGTNLSPEVGGSMHFASPFILIAQSYVVQDGLQPRGSFRPPGPNVSWMQLEELPFVTPFTMKPNLRPGGRTIHSLADTRTLFEQTASAISSSKAPGIRHPADTGKAVHLDGSRS